MPSYYLQCFHVAKYHMELQRELLTGRNLTPRAGIQGLFLESCREKLSFVVEWKNELPSPAVLQTGHTWVLAPLADLRALPLE